MVGMMCDVQCVVDLVVILGFLPAVLSLAPSTISLASSCT